MTRTFGVVAGSALVLSAIAALTLVLRGAAHEPARPAETRQALERARPAASVRLPSTAASVTQEVPREAHAERVAPESIVDTLQTSQDPQAIQAALSAVLTTYSSRSTQKPVPGAELEQALARHVRSDVGAIARAAFAAARVPLMSEAPGAEFVGAFVSATAPEQPPARRMLALEALNLIRPNRRSASALAAMEQALSASQPEVVSQALFALANSGPSLAALAQAARVELAQRVVALASHPSPGVRGRALFVLAEVAELVAAEARLTVALSRLRDGEPYVRAEAANLAGRCRAPRAIHALMAHIADLAAARYDLPFVDIEGRSGVAEHRVPGRPRVAEAALFAILALSREVQVGKPLELTLGGGIQPEARVLENVASVRRWYGEVVAQIPQ